MENLENFFSSSRDGSDYPTLELNPFQVDDALSGAQILEIRYDGIGSSLGIILEMRVAEHDWQGSSGLIVASGVKNFSWVQDPRNGQRTAWTILESVPRGNRDHFTLKLTGSPTFSLSLTACDAWFYSATIDALEGVPPPDYTQHDVSEIHRVIPRWNSIVGEVRAVRNP